MTTITATAARKDLYNLMTRVNEDSKPITITTSKGKSAVLVGEDEWSAIEETLYLNSVPGLTASILEAAKEPLGDCATLDELEW